MYLSLSKKVPVKMVVDAAIGNFFGEIMIVKNTKAYALETADIVLVGAEAVVENGGIINRV